MNGDFVLSPPLLVGRSVGWVRLVLDRPSLVLCTGRSLYQIFLSSFFRSSIMAVTRRHTVCCSLIQSPMNRRVLCSSLDCSTCIISDAPFLRHFLHLECLARLHATIPCQSSITNRRFGASSSDAKKSRTITSGVAGVPSAFVKVSCPPTESSKQRSPALSNTSFNRLLRMVRPFIPSESSSPAI
jgi:hypothetical protein